MIEIWDITDRINPLHNGTIPHSEAESLFARNRWDWVIDRINEYGSADVYHDNRVIRYLARD